MEIKRISSFLSVAPQIFLADVRKIASLGFQTIINNRPDNEKANQPLAIELAAEADRHGLIFVNQWVISGKVTIENSTDFAGELERAKGPVLAFCRSGTRCTMLWAYSEARYRDLDVIMSDALSIGYDLKKYRDLMEQIAAQAKGQMPTL